MTIDARTKRNLRTKFTGYFLGLFECADGLFRRLSQARHKLRRLHQREAKVQLEGQGTRRLLHQQPVEIKKPEHRPSNGLDKSCLQWRNKIPSSRKQENRDSPR